MKKLSFLTLLSCILFLTLTAFTCAQKPIENLTPPTIDVNMTNDYYLKEWAEIEKLENEGLPKSALEKVVLLYNRATKENNYSQVVKAIIYRSKYNRQLSENGEVLAITEWEEEIKSATAPTKQILQSALGQLMNDYAQQNRWRFDNRTETTNFENSDINTWSLEQLSDYTDELYLSSLQQSDVLKSVQIENFNAILTKGNANNLQPVLYDFLARRALRYFNQEQNHLTKPAYTFQLDNPEAFSPTNVFINTEFPTKDESSAKKRVLNIYKNLLAFHKNDKNKEPLVDVELMRLEYVNNNAVLAEKEDLYLTALKGLYDKYSSSSNAGEILATIGQIYFNKGSEYDYDNPEKNSDNYRLAKKTALTYLKKAINNYPNTHGAYLAQNLISGIQNSILNLQVERENIPNKDILLRVNYQNIDKLFVKVIKLNKSIENKLEDLQQKSEPHTILNYLNGLSFSQLKDYALPNTEDYNTHNTEISIDGLSVGKYIIVAGSNAAFSNKENSAGYTTTVVTNLNLWSRSQNNEDEIAENIVYNRETGKPEQGVKVELSYRTYNQRSRKYEYKKLGERTTDANGVAKISLNGNRSYNTSVKLTKGDDIYDPDASFYHFNYRKPNGSRNAVTLFTDRGVYRPNQTIYFKGIALNFDSDRMPTLLTNQKVTVTLKDANYQDVNTQEFTTNEYGTFNGTFNAPKGGLLGSMNIVTAWGSKNIRVEEYKRPKFEVNLKPIKGSFALNETVSVEGEAIAYAGNKTDGATVNYRVVRAARFPYLPWWYRSFNPSSSIVEITNGTTTTDAEGKFTVSFNALADPSIDRKNNPIFSYTVYADVTDITGETQSSTTSVQVGYIGIEVSADIPKEVAVQDFKKITLTTQNINAEFEGTKGTFSLKRLDAPKQLFIDRLWEKPETQIITEQEFKQKFPHFAYNKENEPQTWNVAEKITNNFDTNLSKEINLTNKAIKAGHYIAEINAKDKNGNPVKWSKYFTVFDLKNKVLPKPSIAWHFTKDKVYEPNDNVEVAIGTTDADLYVLFEITKNNKLTESKWIKVKDIYKEILKVNKSDLGNFSYNIYYAKYNRTANFSHTVKVPWAEKELKIEYTTFRDKLLPGQEEEWQIKILGNKGEKVAAEMVATLYDASLDAFVSNDFDLFTFADKYSNGSILRMLPNTISTLYTYKTKKDKEKVAIYKDCSRFNWFGFSFSSYHYYQNEMHIDEVQIRGSRSGKKRTLSAPPASEAIQEELVADSAMAFSGKKSDDEVVTGEPKKISPRENLNETVFFYPNLYTDEDGNVIIKFKMNEALTRWKFLGLAHTKDLKVGKTSKEIITQKELMIVPNAPRFFRENDEIEFTAKVVNMSDKDLIGTANLELINPLTGESIFVDSDFPQEFTVKAGRSERIAWYFNVPEVNEVALIQHMTSAQADNYTDAERSVTPVLTNRMLVTETMPLPINPEEKKTFIFKSMKDKSPSNTLTHKGLTVEFTSNPAWYAVQALPYLMEYPYECTEQIYSRYYANTLASSVANKYPKIKAVFEQWRMQGADALVSNLVKNQELKTALLEEMPWVLQAQSETQQKRNIGLLFDFNKMADEQKRALQKLQERQMANGGFPWFPGGRDNWYITQYLVESLGHLHKLGVTEIQSDAATWSMLQKAVTYCDERIVEYYEDIEKQVKKGNIKWEDDHLSHIAAHYLYTRTFYRNGNIDVALSDKTQKVFDYFIGQSEKYWLKKGIYTEGMIVLALHRTNKSETTSKIVKSLKERALYNEELGMYFKGNGWNWYELPIEQHSLIIEVMDEVANDQKAVEQMKVWLLKNKQTNHWKTTKSTASAVYALLATGNNWLLETTPVSIEFPQAKEVNQQIKEAQSKAEAGTGYFKTRIDGDKVNNNMATVEVNNPNKTIAWGAVYWQYFEQMDKIEQFEDTPLKIKKQLFKVKLTDTGEVISPISAGETLEPGDKLKVRVELRVDRGMEYVHMKDGRASGFEPINVLSSYKYQGGLGYYESTRDASTDFFFSYLPKGVHVFEYPVRVVHKGDFSNGITTVQCMYAPEFTSHSEGIRVGVE